MILRYEVQLDIKDALPLREAIEKRKKFSLFKDYDIFCKDYAKFLKKSKLEFYESKFPPALSLGKHVFPKNSLVNQDGFISFMREDKDDLTKELEIEFGENGEEDGLAFIVRDRINGPFITSFSIYNELMETLDLPKNSYRGLILALGIFFHNKFRVYQKIYNVLTSKKKEYAKIFGSDFIEDFILLFSASHEEHAKEKISILLNSIKKSRIPKNKIQKGWLKIGDIDTFECSWRNIDGSFDYCFGFYLDTNNKLILDVSYSSTNRKRISDFEDKEFDKFIQKIMREWINQYFSAINFTTCIYNKIKAKILLENI